jgi:tetratricopeptide (TPR) repeat protein
MAFEQAIALDANDFLAHHRRGLALWTGKDLPGAAAALRKAGTLAPEFADSHAALGDVLRASGDLPGALAAYRQCLAVAPKYPRTHARVGQVLFAQGKSQEAAAAYRQALAVDPKNSDDHFNLGLALQGTRDWAAAVDAFEQSATLNPKFAAAYRGLAFSRGKQGEFAKALAAARRARELDGKYSAEVFERLVELDRRLPAILDGRDPPKDAAECVTFAEICLYKRLTAAAARLYARAFDQRPELRAQDAEAGYNAACAAAQAGCAQGVDVGPLDEKDKARLRQQALGWLRADLDHWTQEVGKAPDGPALLRQRLLPWQDDPALAGVRDGAALARLPAAERAGWQALWSDVARLVRKDAARDAPPGQPGG